MSTLNADQIPPWIKTFRELGITCNIYVFLVADGACRLVDENGDEVDPSDWVESVTFGKVDSSVESDFDDTDEVEAEVDSENDTDVDIDADADTNTGDSADTDDDIGGDFDVSDVDDEVDSGIEDSDSDYDAFETDDTFNEVEDVDDDSDGDDDDYIAVAAPSKAPVEVEVPSKVDTAPPSKSESADTLATVDEVDLPQKALQKTAKLFLEGHAGRGMLLLHMLNANPAFSDEEWLADLALEAGCILDDPLYSRQMSTLDPFDFWDTFLGIPYADSADDNDYMKLAAMVKSFFAPPEPMSFQLKSRWNQLNDDKTNTALKNCPSAKKLIGLFKTFTDQTHASFAACLNVDHSAIEARLKSAIDAVKAVRERTDAVSHMQLRHPRSQGLVKLLYEPRGVVRCLLDIENPALSEDAIIEYCSQFTDEDLRRPDLQNAAIAEGIFTESKIGDYLDEVWSSIKVDSRRNERFTSVERPRQINVLKQALIAMLSYAFAKRRIEAIRTSGSRTAPVARALDILADLTRELVEAGRDMAVKSIGYAVFSLCVRNLTAQLKGQTNPMFYRDCLLGTKYLELGGEGLPVFTSYDVPAFNFANRVLAYDGAIEGLNIGEAVNSAYETAVRGCDLGVLTLLEGNFRDQLNRSDEELKRRRDNVSKQVERQLDRIYHEFLDNIELDRNYDRITNQEEIERYISVAAEAKEHFTETKNAGLYQRFINACRSEIAKAALPHKNAMEQRLKSLEDSLYADLGTNEELNEKYPVIAEIHRQLDLGNLTVAEDYLNRWSDLGGQLGSFEVTESRNDAFDDFLREYEYIFNACLKNKSESHTHG